METTLQIEHLESMEVELFGKSYTLSPLADLHFSISELGQAMQEQPSKYVFYATLRDEAQKLLNQWNKKLERARSKADARFRQAGHINGSKVTEDGLRRALREEPKVKECEDQVLEVQDLLTMFQTIVRAFEIRRDMIVAASNRTNTGNFQDRDVPFPVELKLAKNLAAAQGRGKHPSK